MTELPRLRPDPIPRIHPVPEYQAQGQLKDWYEDMKQVLQVPWMGVVTMAYAHYPTFYETLWRGARDLSGSAIFVEACQANRAHVEARMAELAPPPILGRLQDAGYGDREIAEIREVVEVFSHGNQPYVVLATIVRCLLESLEMQGGRDPSIAKPYAGRHGPEFDRPLVLMERHHADLPTRQVYDDIMHVLGLPFVNTDYRAFARWPSYWSAAWSDLSGVAGTPPHEAICQDLHDRCVALALRDLPNPGGLTSEALCEAAARDAPLDEVRDVARLFQWLLAGLVTNVAYLRAQLLS